MTTKTINVKIGGHDFRINRFPPFDALRIGGELQRVFGPAIAATAGLQGQSVERMDMSLLSNILMDSAEALGRYLDGPTLETLVRSLLNEETIYVKEKGSKEYVMVTSTDIERYIDDVSDLLVLTKAVLMHNFEELFRKAFALFGANLKKSEQTTKATEATEQVNANPLDD